jgi:ubiquinol-cytochrome c reductase subunit 9
VYVGGIFGGAFVFGVAFDVGVTTFWDRWNKGVRVLLLASSVWRRADRRPARVQKQWKDMRAKYVEAEE